MTLPPSARAATATTVPTPSPALTKRDTRGRSCSPTHFSRRRTKWTRYGLQLFSHFFFVFVESCRSRINKSFTPQVESRSGTLRKPPVPQRCVSLDGSSVSVPMPTGPKPALPSGKKPHITGQQQQQQHPGGQGMPDFSLNKSDMGEK